VSRSLSRFLEGVVGVVTAGQSAKKRAATRARLIERLEAKSLVTVETGRGPLRLISLRGPHLAAAAVGFHEEEPETLAWIDTHVQSGDVLWDVGAATGMFAMYAAQRKGVSVVAFEPKATTFGVLVEHLALNGLGDQIMPLCVALSDAPSLMHLTLTQMAPGSAGNSLAGTANQFGETVKGFNQGVMAMTVDGLRAAFGLPVPTHIKLDVDGVEGPILAGATQTLPHVKSVFVEVEGENIRDVATRIEAPLFAAGFVEDVSVRTAGSGRNRLYVRA
jgi:FkbM family methyltransferase